MITFDEPGTTRDAVQVPVRARRRRYVLIDTAGVRRRARVEEELEKWSVVKTLQAVEDAHVVIGVVDARRNRRRAGRDAVRPRGRARPRARRRRQQVGPRRARPARGDPRPARRSGCASSISRPSTTSRRCTAAASANLMDAVRAAYAAAMREMPTPELTRVLEAAIRQHQPPLVRGRRIRLRYAHQGGRNPPVIVDSRGPGGAHAGGLPALPDELLPRGVPPQGYARARRLPQRGQPVRGSARQADAAPAAHARSATTRRSGSAESGLPPEDPRPQRARARGGPRCPSRAAPRPGREARCRPRRA